MSVERIQRLIRAIGDGNSATLDRGEHLRLVLEMVRDRDALQIVKSEKVAA